MLEAVNSVLQSAPVIRATAEQASTAESLAANPERVQRVAQAPYVSPYISVQDNAVVLQIRDRDTAEVIDQIPSHVNMQARSQAEEQAARVIAAEPQPQPQQAVQVSAPITVQHSGNDNAPAPQQQATTRQIAAFAAAAASGNTNAGTVSLFA